MQSRSSDILAQSQFQIRGQQEKVPQKTVLQGLSTPIDFAGQDDGNRLLLRGKQEQDLYIFHLNQEIKKLLKCRFEAESYSQLIAGLESKCIEVCDSRSRKSQQNESEMILVQSQYSRMYKEMQELSADSVKKYERVLLLQESHARKRGELTQQQQAQSELLSELSIEAKISEERTALQRNAALLLQKQKERKESLSSKYSEFQNQGCVLSMEVETIKQKISAAEQRQQELKYIMEAAVTDNQKLVQKSLELGREREAKTATLEDLQLRKAVLQSQRERADAESKISESQLSIDRQRFIETSIDEKKLSESLSSLDSQNQAVLVDGDRVVASLSQERNLNSRLLLSFQSDKEELRRVLYFIDQYRSLNHELLREIRILVREESAKGCARSREIRVREINDSLSRAEELLYCRDQRLEDIDRAVGSCF